MRLRTGIVCLLMMYLSLSHFAGVACDFYSISKDSFPLRHSVEMGLLTANSSGRAAGELGLALNYTLGVEFTNNLYTGFGLGWMSLSSGSEEQVFPFYMRLGITMPDWKVKPAIHLDAGMAIAADHRDGFNEARSQGGMYFNPSLGCSFPVGERTAVQVGLGYIFQHMSFDYLDFLGRTEEIVDYHRLEIHLAVNF